jgi:hypothetical protein
MVFREFVEHLFQFIVEAGLHSMNFIFGWGMKNDMTPATS